MVDALSLTRPVSGDGGSMSLSQKLFDDALLKSGARSGVFSIQAVVDLTLRRLETLSVDTGTSPAFAGPQVLVAKASEDDMAKAIDAMQRSFDYAIETQLIVRGTTQMASSANTLLRGQ